MPTSDPKRRLNQLEEEAAQWCQRMRGAEAKLHQGAFEQWLTLGAYHAQVYQEVCRIHDDAERLKGVPLHRRTDLWKGSTGSRRWLRPIWYAPAMAASLLVGVTVFEATQRGTARRVLVHGEIASASSDRAVVNEFATKVGDIRSFRLPDGSQLTLDTDSLLRTSFDVARRELSLERGRARFDVAHEERPFVVDAGGGSVIAHGTLFDVDLSSGHDVQVHLLRGAIDVRLPGTRAQSRLVPLAVGQSIAFQAAHAQPTSATTAPSPEWPTGLVGYDGAPLSEVVEQANRYTAVKIVLDDPALGRLLVHGTLRINDARKAAEALSIELDLNLTITSDQIILSRK